MLKVGKWISLVVLICMFKTITPIVAAGQQVVSFTLINASNEQAIQTITHGEVINLATLPSRMLNIRANTSPATVGSVKFVLSGRQASTQVESGAPYALFGDNGGNYNNWTPATGSYTLTGTPYTGSGGSGSAGQALTIDFIVTDQSAQYSLTVATPVNGTVTQNPNQPSYASGTMVTLTATPASGYVFSGWGGDAAGTANPLAVLMNGNKNITATFSIAPAGQQVVSFTLINANNEQAIQTITHGEVINLATLPSRMLNIRANTSPATVGSVKFVLSGRQALTQVESGAPYALFGDNGGNYNNWTPATGSYTLTGTPYTGSGGSGTAGTPLTLPFTVTDEGGGTQDLLLTRGPYLQMASQSAVTLRWRTNTASDSRIEVGTAFGTYTRAATNAVVATEHEVRISGLSAGTRYYYRFGSSTQVLQSGSDNFFVTAPAGGSPEKVRVAVLGDCGRNINDVQPRTLNAYRNYVGSNPAELLLLLGDNAYQNGTDADYQSNFFDPYSSTILKNHVLFPAPGNHDYYSTTQSSRNGAYYNSFTMPTAGESGGVSSGTEAYYSYDWGNIHFISLDSYGTENPNNTRLYDTLGAQVAWVKNDLAANTKPWVVVYFHHPPYTMGSHNSDGEQELIRIRENFIRILERNGVDLVLTGHSHNYERSYLLRNHFGHEASFNPGVHAVSTSSGKYNGTANSCPYVTVNGKTRHGTVYVVSGSAGAVGGTQSGWPHNAMPYSDNGGGMLYLEVEQNRLDAKYLRADGTVWDQFTIMKEVNKTTDLQLAANGSAQLTASWVGTYQWSTGETSRTITVNPAANTVYQVTDTRSCLTDVFRVNLVASSPEEVAAESEKPGRDGKSPEIYPAWVSRGGVLTVRAPGQQAWIAEIFDMNGRRLYASEFSGRAYVASGSLAPGLYVLRLQGKSTVTTHKFIVTH